MNATRSTGDEQPQDADAVTAQRYPCESGRISFVVARDGMAAAVDFCRRTGHIYRAAALANGRRGHRHPHFASLPEYRARFIGSYLDFKRFYLGHRGDGGEKQEERG
ncbi:MAG TPA: hypothetical protein VF925_12665 [Casimicrobiaceae bacterium]